MAGQIFHLIEPDLRLFVFSSVNDDAAKDALHEFSVRYRAALAKQHPTPEQGLDTLRDAVREQYEHERAEQSSRTPEPPSAAPERAPEQDGPEA
jgi:hypothetical protein